MRTVRLNAAPWKSGIDFYNAILPALGAPEWHGKSVNALVESMICGEINEVAPPYTVEIYGTKSLPDDVMQEIDWTREGLAHLRAYYAATEARIVQVEFKIID